MTRPQRASDTPGAKHPLPTPGFPLPTRWRWVASTPEGKIYLGINAMRSVCVAYQARAATTSCSSPGWAQPAAHTNYGYGETFVLVVAPNGFDTADFGKISCNIHDNVALLVNPPAGDFPIIVTGPGVKSTLSLPSVKRSKTSQRAQCA